MAFLVVVDLSLPRISTLDVLAFMEYQAQSGMSPDNITNHITGIRSMSIVYGIDTTPFRDQRIPLFIKSLKINNIHPMPPRTDKTTHLCVGDMVFAFQRAVIVVKWSKTLKDRVKTTTIDIPYLGASALCPIAALKKMLATYPSHQDSSVSGWLTHTSHRFGC